ALGKRAVLGAIGWMRAPGLCTLGRPPLGGFRQRRKAAVGRVADKRGRSKAADDRQLAAAVIPRVVVSAAYVSGGAAVTTIGIVSLDRLPLECGCLLVRKRPFAGEVGRTLERSQG